MVHDPSLSAQIAKAVSAYVKSRKEDIAFLQQLERSTSRVLLAEELAQSLYKQFADQLPEKFDLKGLIESQLARLARFHLHPKEAREQRIITFRMFLTDDIQHTLDQSTLVALDKKIHTKAQLEPFAQEVTLEIAQQLLRAKKELEQFDTTTREKLAKSILALERRYTPAAVKCGLARALGLSFIEEAKIKLSKLFLIHRNETSSKESMRLKIKELLDQAREKAKREVQEEDVLQRILKALDQLEKSSLKRSGIK